MTGSLRLRIGKAEEVLVLSDDHRRLEALKRECYNLPRVSTESLILKLCGLLGGFREPVWVSAEFDRPIPSDAGTSLVREAESQADDMMRLAGNVIQPDAPFSQTVFKALEKSLEDLSRFVGQQFSTLDDVRVWCEGDGKEYQPCH